MAHGVEEAADFQVVVGSEDLAADLQVEEARAVVGKSLHPYQHRTHGDASTHDAFDGKCYTVTLFLQSECVK